MFGLHKYWTYIAYIGGVIDAAEIVELVVGSAAEGVVDASGEPDSPDLFLDVNRQYSVKSGWCQLMTFSG